MTSFGDFVEEVRNANDIIDVIGEDIELNQTGSTFKGLSPFNAESTPSFVVWPDSQRWVDYSGGGNNAGDVFDYVQQRDGSEFIDALNLLAGGANIRRPNQDEESYERGLSLAQERRFVEDLLTKAATYYHKALPREIRNEMYKQGYGFTDETIDGLLLGYADGGLLKFFKDELGVEHKVALKTGLFVVANGQVVDFFQSRLMFPYWQRGKVVYFAGRKTERTPDKPWEAGKYKKLPTHSAKFPYVSESIQNSAFYNEDSARRAKELLITEGITDCITAMQAGIPCVSPATTSFRKQDLPKVLALSARCARVTVCNDSEENGSGRKGAILTAKELHAAGRDVRLSTLPRPDGVEKVDINSYVVANGVAALRDVISEAKRLIPFLVDLVPKDTNKLDLEEKLDPVLDLIASASPLDREANIDALIDRFSVGRQTIKSLLKSRKRAQEKVVGDDTRPTSLASVLPHLTVLGVRNGETLLFDRSARQTHGFTRFCELDYPTLVQVAGADVLANVAPVPREGERRVPLATVKNLIALESRMKPLAGNRVRGQGIWALPDEKLLVVNGNDAVVWDGTGTFHEMPVLGDILIDLNRSKAWVSRRLAGGALRRGAYLWLDIGQRSGWILASASTRRVEKRELENSTGRENAGNNPNVFPATRPLALALALP